MSRIHEALRKAGSEKPDSGRQPGSRKPLPVAQSAGRHELSSQGGVITAENEPDPNASSLSAAQPTPVERLDGGFEKIDEALAQATKIDFRPSPESLIIDPARPREAPSEEFRSLRTRLNHLQGNQNLHTVVITSASPGEGKSFTACNLAVSQAQLHGKRILLMDFDFRRPSVQKVMGLSGGAGMTDYLLGEASLGQVLRKMGDSELYVITAGRSVPNPLELLNLPGCATLLENLRDHFDWVILDSPPLLFAADANLLSTMSDGTILVVRIGTTTFDSVTRAVASLCENNILGVVVNGANRGELYSKYSYYHNYYYTPEALASGDEPAVAEDQPALN